MALQKLYPGKIDFEKCRFLIGNRRVVDALKRADDADPITAEAQSDANDFDARRKAFLLY